MDCFLKCLTLTILLSVHVSYTSAELTEFLYMSLVMKEVQCLAHFMDEGYSDRQEHTNHLIFPHVCSYNNLTTWHLLTATCHTHAKWTLDCIDTEKMSDSKEYKFCQGCVIYYAGDGKGCVMIFVSVNLNLLWLGMSLAILLFSHLFFFLVICFVIIFMIINCFSVQQNS